MILSALFPCQKKILIKLASRTLGPGPVGARYRKEKRLHLITYIECTCRRYVHDMRQTYSLVMPINKMTTKNISLDCMHLPLRAIARPPDRFFQGTAWAFP